MTPPGMAPAGPKSDVPSKAPPFIPAQVPPPAPSAPTASCVAARLSPDDRADTTPGMPASAAAPPPNTGLRRRARPTEPRRRANRAPTPLNAAILPRPPRPPALPPGPPRNLRAMSVCTRIVCTRIVRRPGPDSPGVPGAPGVRPRRPLRRRRDPHQIPPAATAPPAAADSGLSPAHCATGVATRPA